MAKKCYDVAVLGLGAMGAFACLELVRRGASVVGFDRFTPPHNLGSHSGDTRIFRTACSEGDCYVPLAQRAGVLWDRLGQEAGKPFLHRSGFIRIGAGDHPAIVRTRAVAAKYKLPLEELNANEIETRFPAFKVPEVSVGLLERSAGWVDVEGALRFALERAGQSRVKLQFNSPVTNWRPDGTAFRIETKKGSILAERLIITAGAWAGRLLSDLQLPLVVLRKVMVWINPIETEAFRSSVLIPFSFAEESMYGFPNLEDRGVKLAFHRSGNVAVVEPGDSVEPDPDGTEIEPLLQKASQLMPKLAGPLPDALRHVVQAKTCYYTMTPDEDFIIDRHPGLNHVWFAAGFSGHGFKYAPAVGEALAESTLQGETSAMLTPWAVNKRFS